jgi:esterase/lipase superfamily enzyme
MSDLKVVRIQTQQPSRDYSNPGRIEECAYALDDGFVQLYSMDGMSMGPEHRKKLPPHLTANEWAAKMLRETVGARRSNFNRPLRYQPTKY